MRVGGLFSGIGGWELGLERAGFDIAWHCESDPYCRRVLNMHWPEIPCYDDVRRLRGARVAKVHERPPKWDRVSRVDVLCGGFPCQDISLAGAGAGLDGARSGLWSEYARLVGELRPRYVLVENVSALLGRGLGTVLSDLAAVGYDAEWDCIPASAVGAPHQRDRLWIVAYPDSDDGRARRQGRPAPSGAGQPVAIRALPHPDSDDEGRGVIAEHDSGPHQLGGRAPRGHADGLRDEVADADGTGRSERRRAIAVPTQQPPPQRSGEEPAGARAADCWAVEPDVGRVAHGVPHRVDRLRGLGNALVPQLAEWIGRRILEHEGAPGRAV